MFLNGENWEREDLVEGTVEYTGNLSWTDYVQLIYVVIGGSSNGDIRP